MKKCFSCIYYILCDIEWNEGSEQSEILGSSYKVTTHFGNVLLWYGDRMESF